MNPSHDDGFKWFGEGFDGFPKRLPDDCVEYTIHIVDSTLAELAVRERLRKIQDAGASLTKKMLRDFIWQRDGFDLGLVREDGSILCILLIDVLTLKMYTGFNVLRGRTNYGDSVGDEWIVVYLLRELSRQFPEAWVQVVDTDGEFLLIEAANALPKWLNPEVAENRVRYYSLLRDSKH